MKEKAQRVLRGMSLQMKNDPERVLFLRESTAKNMIVVLCDGGTGKMDNISVTRVVIPEGWCL